MSIIGYVLDFFNQVVSIAGTDGGDNLADNLLVNQEVLSKAFSRLVLYSHQAPPLLVAICAATSMAVCRLPLSALPVAARSSAVP